MEIVSLASASHFRSDTPDREDRRERRGGQRRRREDAAETGYAQIAGPSVEFLIQVAAQMRPAHEAHHVASYAQRAWRCGVCENKLV
jgi:hypothetical protein